MKFTDGNWLLKEGIEVFNPVDVHDVEVKDNSIRIYAFYKNISHRGDTLQGPLLTIEFTSPVEDIIGVRIFHNKGQKKKGPEFNINYQNPEVKIENNEEIVSLTSGNTTVRVKKDEDFMIEFLNGDQRITASSPRSMGYILKDGKTSYMREQLDIGVGECVYGLGERFTPFVKNGQVVDIWNRDGGTSSEQAYKNVPFYLTNKGYGVFVNHPEKVSFEVGSERVAKTQFSVPGEELEYFVINGPSLKKVLERYTTLTGKPSLPPAWSFGLWLTTSFTTSYDEETVNSFVDGMADRDLPLHVFHFDCFWMKEFHWCDFKWDNRVFPDPEGMLERLKEKGLKICVWINPYIAQRSYLFDEGKKKGYLLKKPDGDVWQWDKWQPGMAIVDFTNPEACKWYQSKLEELIDMGVDCFKTDFGERIPTDVEYYDGSDPVKMHNYYSYQYNKVVYELLEDKLGEEEAVFFARSGTAGSQQFPVHWGGDCDSDYESMAESLRGGLSLCMSGFSYWSHDIGGFESTATADLYKRWVAFGLLSSHSRLHGSQSYRVPWLFDEEAVDVLRFFTKLKCSLMPYIYKNAYIASKKGIPVMRSMIMEFQDDPACDYLDRQYMLGDSLLVAPVFAESGDVSYYLPAGKWTNFITGEVVEGNHWVKENHDYMSIPLMVRPNSIIAVGDEDNRPDYDYAEDVILQVYELEEGKTASTEIYGINRNRELTVEMKRENNIIYVDVIKNTCKPYSILLKNIPSIESVENGNWEKVKDDVKVFPVKDVERIVIKL